MKKTYLLAALLFVTYFANAQFFQHLYGTSNHEAVGNGVNTTATGLGHFIVSPSSNSSNTDVLAVNTNTSGGVAAFNNLYTLIHSSGITLNARNTLPLEFSNGSGYAVIGQFDDPSGSVPSGIYYIELDPTGTVVNVTEYNPVNITGTNFYVVEVAAIRESSSGDIYITGTVDPAISSGSFWIFSMKISQGGGIIWSVIHDIVNPGFSSSRDWAKDIIESPYSPSGVTEVVVVGHTYGNGGSSDAFFLRLDDASGAALNTPVIYGTTSTFEQFTCIDVANSTAGGSSGFIIGGNSDASVPSRDYWVCKVDPTGGLFWSNLYDYNGGSSNFDICSDIIERLNTNGLYEYFVAGTTDNGNIGNQDIVVQKIDDNGNPYGGGQFTYGDNDNDMGAYLDQYDNTGVDGLSVFGTYMNASGMGLGDALHVKAYFNGIIGCNEDLANTSPNSGPGIRDRYRTKLLSNINDIPMSATNTSASDLNICFNTSVWNGDNSRIAPVEPEGDEQGTISPNPMHTGTNVVNVTVESHTNETATVAIYDMVGRMYYNNSFTLSKGNNNLSLDVSTSGMAAGMYTVRVSSANTNHNILLMVK